MRFMLGTHMVNWLWSDDPRLEGVTFFISRSRLALRSPNRRLPRALHDWCLDSSSFSMLQKHGRWIVTAEEYVAEVRRYREQLGRMIWAAPRDLMCEPAVIYGGVMNGQRFVGTRELRGLAPGDPEQDLTTAVRIHQRMTVDDYLNLVRLAPEIPWIPVIQGWSKADYEFCADLYEAAGVDLKAAPVVGMGSVCRRQDTEEIRVIASTLAARGYKIHGFGVAIGGLTRYGEQLASSDSMAWSFGARYESKLPGCTHRAKRCANCMTYALRWRSRVLQWPARAAELAQAA